MAASITPRPIAWVSTLSAEGVANLAPFSFYNGVCPNPPAVVFSATNRRDGRPKDTLVNVRQTRQFVLNVVSEPLVHQMNLTAAELDYGVNEFDHAGLNPIASALVRPPRVREAMVHMECELLQVVEVGSGSLAGNLVIGQIVLMHIDDRVIAADGQIDAGLLATVGRLGGDLYCTTRERFELGRP